MMPDLSYGALRHAFFHVLPPTQTVAERNTYYKLLMIAFHARGLR